MTKRRVNPTFTLDRPKRKLLQGRSPSRTSSLSFFRWLWRLIVVFKRFLPSGFPVCVDFLHQFLRVVLRGRWDRGLYSLFRVGIGLDVGPVYENRLGGQISRFRHLFQYPRKDLVHDFCGKPMTEIITHRGKMRRFLLKRISQKPTAADICADLIRCSPQGRHAVQMLNQHHFEQHNRVHTGPLGTKLSVSTISMTPRSIFPRSSIFHHPEPFYHINAKSQAGLEFFDKLQRHREFALCCCMLYTLYKPLTYYLLFCPVGVSGRRYTLPERS